MSKLGLREFLMLAKKYEPSKKGDYPLVGGWLCSEKLDGERAFWDGGVSRGKDATEVPWANTEKDGRLLERPIATGLWTRYGKVIHAPDWWLDDLPVRVLCDGELWAGRGQFQRLRSIVGTHAARCSEDAWASVGYYCFGFPKVGEVFRDGEIRNTNYRKIISLEESVKFVGNIESPISLNVNETFKILEQRKIPGGWKESRDFVISELARITDLGGEGLMLRCPGMPWEPKRSDWLLKVKRRSDAEGVVTGYTWGRETDKGSKLLGLMGALIVKWKGSLGEKEFELSGFSEAERELRISPCGDQNEGRVRAGERCSNDVTSVLFPRGSLVTFTYREETDDGLPKEAAFLRRR